MTSTYYQIVKDFQKRAFVNIYLFYGEEPYYIDELSDYLTQNVLTDIEKEFNQTVMYGRDSTAAHAVNCSKQFSCRISTIHNSQPYWYYAINTKLRRPNC
jgi:DNA polymerase III delta subunit